MTDTNPYLNNPLHGLKLETLVTELVEHYGFEILAEYTRIKCFDKKPCIKSSIKFLKKTAWAREKLEIFYLYKYKNLPKPDDTNYALPPRERIVPEHQKPRQPIELVLGEAPPPKQRSSQPNNSSRNRSSNRASNDPYKQNSNPKRSHRDQDEPWDPWAAHR
ncbi:VF530 family DNA-binding protein [Catenovulum adriaticum]|uniref:VF530 family DNA-binding protein n=1 Tax=Catenovulum adriaticum TaxID=2984846 RepID=A0ABY7AMR4_9ALTE|nr:VF530 family DNA-binding protein [Catenovulum sp. TS8]WAJ70605.1 VF530 family DNA-binding protein [Catenovulum sp. TS8]